jgi:hypothetical protein
MLWVSWVTQSLPRAHFLSRRGAVILLLRPALCSPSSPSGATVRGANSARRLPGERHRDRRGPRAGSSDLQCQDLGTGHGPPPATRRLLAAYADEAEFADGHWSGGADDGHGRRTARERGLRAQPRAGRASRPRWCSTQRRCRRRWRCSDSQMVIIVGIS